MSEQRVRYRDYKPYAIVASLHDLRGPEAGSIQLPLAIQITCSAG